MSTPASDRERGTGLIGSLAGVSVFLALLTVGVQVLVDLYQTSVVTAAAFDVARSVAARHEGDGTTPSEAELLAAEARLRDLLGGIGDEARLEWDVDGAAGVVRLHVVVPTRRFLLPAVSGPLGLDEVDRTVAVRLERPQG